MASTYSPNLRLELIGTGEQQGSWGSTTNTNLGTLLEQAIGGYTSVTVTDGADTTLTTSNGASDQSRNAVINLTGALTATRNVICPAIQKVYIVKNATTGSQSVVFKVSGQTGVTIPNGTTYLLYVDGTDARLASTLVGTIATQNANNVTITGGSISGAAVTASASNLSVLDADGSNKLSIAVGSNLTANTTLTLTTGATADRTLDISASNVTITTAGAALIDDATNTDQRTTLGLGTIATQNSNNVTVTGGSITGITDLALADGGTGASLSDPGADAILGWNDTANTMRFFTAGTGISINATSNTISSTVSGGGDYVMQTFTNTTPGGVTWTKPAGLVAVKVTIVGGGGGTPSPSSNAAADGAGGGGAAIKYIPAPSIPGPVTVTVGAGGSIPAPTGGTSSFGSFASATGGSSSTAGAGSNGTYNISGQVGGLAMASPVTTYPGPPAAGIRITQGGAGGGSILGFGGVAPALILSSGSASPGSVIPYGPSRPATAGGLYGGGASGAVSGPPANPSSGTGAAGGQGVVIVEEFY